MPSRSAAHSSRASVVLHKHLHRTPYRTLIAVDTSIDLFSLSSLLCLLAERLQHRPDDPRRTVSLAQSAHPARLAPPLPSPAPLLPSFLRSLGSHDAFPRPTSEQEENPS